MKDKKIIIFGTGNILKQYIESIDLDFVLLFIDNNIKKQDTKLYGKAIISPEKIKEYEFDYVVIFSIRDFQQMYIQLESKAGIPSNKIISWKYYMFNSNMSKSFFYVETLQFIIKLVVEMNLSYIFDVKLAFIRMNIFNKQNNQFSNIGNIHIDGYNNDRDKEIFPIHHNIYDNIYADFDNCKNNIYDAIVFTDMFLLNSVYECAELIKKTYGMSRYVILNLPYPSDAKYMEWIQYEFSSFGKVRKIPCYHSIIIIIDKTPKKNSGELKIFVVTHKKFTHPTNNIYVPIHAGKKGQAELGYIGDDTGDNISELNPWINECTALYWIWKNVSCQYIGLNHYRRYFLKNSINDKLDILDEECVISILKKYDIILAAESISYGNTVKKIIEDSVCQDAYMKGMAIIEEIITEKYSDYLPAFNYLFNGYGFYPCNLFVTRKEIMDRYCKWLFDIIIDAASRIDISEYDSYSKRIIGFMAERLFSVWLIKNELKIKELPMIITE